MKTEEGEGWWEVLACMSSHVRGTSQAPWKRMEKGLVCSACGMCLCCVVGIQINQEGRTMGRLRMRMTPSLALQSTALAHHTCDWMRRISFGITTHSSFLAFLGTIYMTHPNHSIYSTPNPSPSSTHTRTNRHIATATTLRQQWEKARSVVLP
jgi:hypothetical protein